MKRIFVSVIALCFLTGAYAQNKPQLAPPLLKFRSAFFADTAMLQMDFRLGNTSIHYTMNGKDPGQDDPQYKKPLVISDKITTVKARTFGKDFSPSETVAVSFIKSGLPFKVMSQSEPGDQYKGKGLNTLTDNMGGLADHANGDWLGYQQDSVEITMEADQAYEVNELLLDFLRDQGSWIFMPESISVYAWVNNDYVLAGSDKTDAAAQIDGSNCIYRLIDFGKRIKTSKLLIRINTVKNIPDWHPGKGNHAWMFIDEIKVY